MKAATYSVYTQFLGPNMQLFLFSDGITEMLPEKTMDAKEQQLLSMAVESQGI